VRFKPRSNYDFLGRDGLIIVDDNGMGVLKPGVPGNQGNAATFEPGHQFLRQGVDDGLLVGHGLRPIDTNVVVEGGPETFGCPGDLDRFVQGDLGVTPAVGAGPADQATLDDADLHAGLSEGRGAVVGGVARTEIQDVIIKLCWHKISLQ